MKKRRILGIVTNRDMRFAEADDTPGAGDDDVRQPRDPARARRPEEAISLMKARRIEKAAGHRCRWQADRASDAQGYRAGGAAPGGLQG
jgi:hypothetical protein